MSERIIRPGEVGEQFELVLTAAGLRAMLQDMRHAGMRIPNLILVSEYDRRGLNQDLLGMSTTEVAKADQRPEHDGKCIGMIEGVAIGASPHVPRGKCRFVFPPEKKTVSERLGGEGLIIVGA